MASNILTRRSKLVNFRIWPAMARGLHKPCCINQFFARPS
jgi:hypothetical protein